LVFPAQDRNASRQCFYRREFGGFPGGPSGGCDLHDHADPGARESVRAASGARPDVALPGTRDLSRRDE